MPASGAAGTEGAERMAPAAGGAAGRVVGVMADDAGGAVGVMAGDGAGMRREMTAAGVRAPALTGPISIVPSEGFAAHGLATPSVFSPPPSLSNHGGPVIGNVQLVPIYWGADWATGTDAALSTQLDGFFDYILTSPMMDMLAEYSTPSTTIGHGARPQSVRVTNSEPGTVSGGQRIVTDAQIQAAIQGWIANGTLPPTTGDHLYFAFLPPNVVSELGSSASCQQYCGYHNSFGGNVYYAVIPYANCNGCEFTGAFLDTLTEVTSHELCEAVTDPALNAWWDSSTGNEIGDICNRDTVRLGGYLIQTEWSNHQAACVMGSASIRASGPVVAWGPNRLDAFVIGTDHGLYHKAWDGAAWRPSLNGYEAEGGIIDFNPEVVAWGPNRLDVFVAGTDHALYHKAWDGAAWRPSLTGYESLGGIILGRPKAVSWGPNRLDMFVKGTDSALYHKWWDGSQWGPSQGGYEGQGGILMGDPEAVSWGPNRLDVFVLGTDSAIYHKWRNGSAWGPSLTGYEYMGGVCTSSPKAVCWRADGSTSSWSARTRRSTTSGGTDPVGARP